MEDSSITDLLEPLYSSRDAATSGPNYSRPVDDDGTGDNAGAGALDGQGRQLSHATAFFCDRAAVDGVARRVFSTHLYQRDHEFLLAGDATTVTKAAHRRTGSGFFFGGIGW